MGRTVATPNWYPDPAAAGRLRYWDGSAWTSDTSPAQPYGGQPKGKRGRRTVAIATGVAVLACLLGLSVARLLGLSLNVSSIHTGDATIAEFRYSQEVRSEIAALQQAVQGLHPVCDQGGQLRGCYEADLAMMTTLNNVLTDLDRTTVPPRYAIAHQHLVGALTQDLHGFTLRNKAIAGHNNAEWQRSNTEIQRAAAATNSALAEYPKDTVLNNG
jgi:hypothetical protein